MTNPTSPLPFKLLILDVDGVLTDGGMYYGEGGEESKKFNVKDGLGIQLITTKYNFPVGIISNGITKNLIQRRANLLGIQKVFVDGKAKKIDVLKQWCSEMKIKLTDVAYIGDDVNDLECMLQVGLAACPADAVEKIKAVAHLQLTKNGGCGCVREFVEMYFDI